MLTLKKKTEFNKVIRKGEWLGGNLLNIYIIKNNNNSNLFGVAVSKKVSKSSVKRNRIKRLIREAYRKNECYIPKGYNIIIIWKNSKPFFNATLESINKDLIYCINKFTDKMHI